MYMYRIASKIFGKSATLIFFYMILIMGCKSIIISIYYPKCMHLILEGGDFPTHYGGEFFAANQDDAKIFANSCIDIFSQMRKCDFVTTYGDEFITSLAAKRMTDRIKNAGAYVYRFWTGRFRLISTCYEYNPVVVLHVPAEKERGMIKLFDKYIWKGKYPSRRKVYRLMHLSHRSLRTIIAQLIYTIKNR